MRAAALLVVGALASGCAPTSHSILLDRPRPPSAAPVIVVTGAAPRGFRPLALLLGDGPNYRLQWFPMADAFAEEAQRIGCTHLVAVDDYVDPMGKHLRRGEALCGVIEPASPAPPAESGRGAR